MVKPSTNKNHVFTNWNRPFCSYQNKWIERLSLIGNSHERSTGIGLSFIRAIFVDGTINSALKIPGARKLKWSFAAGSC